MEDKVGGGGRVVGGGTKVSKIANIFQAMKEGGGADVIAIEPPLKSPDGGGGGGPPPVTVVRTESHVARFNNARALFEKLGEENRGRTLGTEKSKTNDLRSRSSSTNSSGGGESPVRANREPSPASSQVKRGQVATENGGLHPKTNGTYGSNEYLLNSSTPSIKEKEASVITPGAVKATRPTAVGVKPAVNGGAAGAAVAATKPAKPEKPERKLNSRELIEKQKNWTSHFSKSRTSAARYNSDPVKTEVKATIVQAEQQQQQQPAAAVSSVSAAAASPAARSASFNAPRVRSPPPPHPSTPPPPPPHQDHNKVEEPLVSPISPTSRIIDSESEKRLREDDGGIDSGGGQELKRTRTSTPNQQPQPTSPLAASIETKSPTSPAADLTSSASFAKPVYNFNGDVNKNTTFATEAVETDEDGIYHFQPANVSSDSITSSDLTEVEAPKSSTILSDSANTSLLEEEEALLRKLDELSVRSEEVKPVRFNLGDSAELKAGAVAAMCSSSMSEDDSGFVSSETAPIRDLDSGLMDSFVGISDSCAGLLDNSLSDSKERLLEGGLLDVPDVQYADEDSSEDEEKVKADSGVQELSQTGKALNTTFMTPDEADNLLSMRILAKRTRQEALLSDEEAQEVVKLLSPTPEPTDINGHDSIAPPDCHKLLNNTETLNVSTNNTSALDDRLATDKLKLDHSIASSQSSLAATGEDSSVASRQFISESDLSTSRDSLDELDRTAEGDEEEDKYKGFVPEPNKVVFEESGVHYYEDGHFWVEVAGLPEAESEDDEEAHIPVKQNTKVKFSSGPIKVYSTFSMNEYDRRNEDVDPVAASAEYELEKRVEKLQMISVELLKGPEGLGLSIIGMGVGADAGLEKLGIFVKTITEGGAASKDNRIQVNDQIIEVDGKSLVGVTQAYAASVLRNTYGHVKFLIGREVDPVNSEVAQLIRQSLQADKERDEHRRQLERNRNQFLEEESNASSCNDDLHSSQRSLDDDVSADALRQLLHESQLKAATAEAEVGQLKARLEELEESGASREECTEKLRQSGLRLRELERSLAVAKNQSSTYQDMLDQSQGQYMILEKKYCKAKRLLREFQRREMDLLHREEFYLQLLQEKDTEYNALVKALKDRIIQIEQELLDTQRRAGFPARLPHDTGNLRLSTPQLTRRPSAVQPLLEQLGAEISEAEDSPEEGDKTSTVERKMPVKEELDRAVPQHELLDVSANKSKAELATRGGLANRQLPTSGKKPSGGISNSSSEYGLDESCDGSEDDESGSRKQYNDFVSREEQYAAVIRHQQQSLQPLQQSQQQQMQQQQKHQQSPDPWVSRHTHNRGYALSGPPPTLAEQLKQVLAERERRLSGSSDPNLSSVSQTLADEIRQAVNEANARVKKAAPPQSLVPGAWPTAQQSSPSSSGSVSPGVMTADPSPSKLASSDSSDVWASNQSQDMDSATTTPDKKSHIWHTAPVPDWSKEQVCQWLLALGLEQHIPKFLEQQVDGTVLLSLESRDLKNLNIMGDDKSRLKRKLKELKTQVEKEKRQIDKERKEKERLLKKAEKLAEKANKRK